MKTLLAQILLMTLLASAASHASLVFEKEKIEATPAALDRDVSARYPFRNTGDRPVRVIQIKTDCSCATAVTSQESYAPGESGEVVVKFQISGRQGPQKRTIIVSMDDAAAPRQVLLLTAELPQILVLSTKDLLWMATDEPTAKTVVVTTPATVPLRELRARLQHPALSAEVQRVSATEFHVHVKPRAGTHHIASALYLDGVVAEGIVKQAAAFVRVR